MKRFFDRLTNAELLLGAIGLGIAIILNFCQVVNRYWLHYEVMWLGDLMLYIFIFSIYSAISYSSAIKAHISVDIFPDAYLKNDKLKLEIYLFIKYIITVVMIVSFVPSAWVLFKRSVMYPEYATMVRWFNLGWLSYVMAAMVVLAVAHYSWHAARSVFEIRKCLWLRSEGKE